MLKFIARNYVLLLAVAAVSVLGSVEALAVQTAPDNTALGPFAEFLRRGADLFYYTRNALFVVAAFVFIKFAWSAMIEGKFEWKELFWLVVSLVLLGVAGFMVSWFGGSGVTSALIKDKTGGIEAGGFRDSGWKDTKGFDN